MLSIIACNVSMKIVSELKQVYFLHLYPNSSSHSASTAAK